MRRAAAPAENALHQAGPANRTAGKLAGRNHRERPLRAALALRPHPSERQVGAKLPLLQLETALLERSPQALSGRHQLRGAFPRPDPEHSRPHRAGKGACARQNQIEGRRLPQRLSSRQGLVRCRLLAQECQREVKLLELREPHPAPADLPRLVQRRPQLLLHLRGKRQCKEQAHGLSILPHASQKHDADPLPAASAPARGAAALRRDVPRCRLRRGLRRAQHQHRRDARRRKHQERPVRLGDRRRRPRHPRSASGLRLLRRSRRARPAPHCPDPALIADGNREPGPVNMSRTPLPTYYQVRTPLASIDVARKIELLQQADAAARSYDKRVKQVTGAYADQTREILVANTLGHLAEDRQDLCRLSVQCVAFGKNGERRTGFYGGGGRVDFRFFEDFSPGQVGREAARQAVATLGAVPAPSGPQTVVLAPGWSGILLHEAVGHGLEADFIRKGTSLFAGKLGEKVASELVTVIDDGTVAGGRGSINVDDEGVPAERKVLIEDGVLKGYLYDHLNAKLTGQRSTGSGRRQSFRYAPLPRMTNTYLAPGDQTPEEIVGGVAKGLYCRQFGGGQVDISNGNFVFEISEAYLIEKGEITKPVKGAMLIGVGSVAFKNVSAVGSDVSLAPGLGTCGKDGQAVPVGVGLPTVRIDNVTVGGTGG